MKKKLKVLLFTVWLMLVVIGIAKCQEATVFAEDFVAVIGETGYTSLKAAVNAAANGDTITLIADDNVSLTDESEIEIKKSITITGGVDSDGKPLYTIYGTPGSKTQYNDIFIGTPDIDVTISNIKFANFGNEVDMVTGKVILWIGTRFTGTITIDNVHIRGINSRGILLAGGNFDVKNCVIDCASTVADARTKGIEIQYAATGTISNTKISGVTASGNKWTSAGIEYWGTAPVTVSACTIESLTNGISTGYYLSSPGSAADGTLTVKNCTVSAEDAAIATFIGEEEQNINQATVIIEGGTYSGELSVIDYSGGNIQINSGSFTGVINDDSDESDEAEFLIYGGFFDDVYGAIDHSAEGYYPFEEEGSGEIFEVLPSVKVTFNPNTDSSSSESEEQEAVEQNMKKGVATQLTKNSFTNGTKVFLGWNTQEDGNGNFYADEAEVTLAENLVLYACWDEIPAVITANVLTYNGEDQALISVSGALPEGELQFALSGSAGEAPDPNAWSIDIPVGKNADTYYVWYKVVQGEEETIPPTFLLSVTIAKRSASFLTISPVETVFHYEKLLSQVPVLTVMDGETPLNTPADYTVVYYKKKADGSWEAVEEANVINIGTYKAVLEFVNYEAKDGGEVAVEFLITAPEIVGHSLVLSGTIGVNFYLRLPEISGLNYNGSAMTFDVNGKKQTVALSKAVRVDGFYRFTCELTSIEMADDIIAKFSYKWDNEPKTLEDKKEGVYEAYSAKQYITDSQGLAFDTKTRNLVNALADYGHYVQPYLAERNGWTIRTDHKEMDKFFTTYSDAEVLAVLSKVSNMGISIKRSSKIAKVSYSLTLDSGTALNIYFTPVDSYKGTPSVTVNGAKASFTKDGDRFVVSIRDIPAYKLGTMNTIVLKTGSVSTTVKVSAMSYVRDVLRTAGDDEDARKNAFISLYKYYAAAAAYKG